MSPVVVTTVLVLVILVVLILVVLILDHFAHIIIVSGANVFSQYTLLSLHWIPANKVFALPLINHILSVDCSLTVKTLQKLWNPLHPITVSWFTYFLGSSNIDVSKQWKRANIFFHRPPIAVIVLYRLCEDNLYRALENIVNDSAGAIFSMLLVF